MRRLCLALTLPAIGGESEAANVVTDANYCPVCEQEACSVRWGRLDFPPVVSRKDHPNSAVVL